MEAHPREQIAERPMEIPNGQVDQRQPERHQSDSSVDVVVLHGDTFAPEFITITQP